MRAVILAAGKGERMRPLTLAKPKPLLEVCGVSLIEHHLLNLSQAGFTDIIINVSWLAQQILHKLGNGDKYGVKIRYSDEGSQPLETGGGLFNALRLIGDETFLVVNADVKTDFDFATLNYSLDSTILAHLILVNNPEHNSKGDFSLKCDSTLSHQDPENKFTYAGIGLYQPKLFAHCHAGIYSVVPLLKQAMDTKQVTGQLYQGKWDDIGSIDRLIAINKDCKKSSK